MFTRNNAGPYDLQDLTEVNLREGASDMLEVKYLSTASIPVANGVWPVHGVLYGPSQHPLVCLPTQLGPNMPCKNIIFLVDTGAIVSKLSPAAFSALGSEAIPRATRGIVNGVHCKLQLCANPGYSVLGADYLIVINGLLTINYKLNAVTIDRVAGSRVAVAEE